MCLKNYGGWLPYKEDKMFGEEYPKKPIKKSLVEDSPFSYQEGGSHYQDDSGVPQVAEWCMRKNLGFAEGNIVKYIARHEKKNGIEDIKKAMQYLKFIAYVKYGEII